MDQYGWTRDERAPYIDKARQYRRLRQLRRFPEADQLRAELEDAGVEVLPTGVVFNPFRESPTHRSARIRARGPAPWPFDLLQES